MVTPSPPLVNLFSATDGTSAGASIINSAVSEASRRRGLMMESKPNTVAVLRTVVSILTSKLLTTSARAVAPAAKSSAFPSPSSSVKPVVIGTVKSGKIPLSSEITDTL